MDAPLAETIIRFLLALLTTAAGIALVVGWRRARDYPASPLLAYLAGTTLAYAAWRWYVLWLGVQVDADGTWARDVEPYVRSIGNVLLLLVFLALLLISVFHARRLR